MGAESVGDDEQWRIKFTVASVLTTKFKYLRNTALCEFGVVFLAACYTPAKYVADNYATKDHTHQGIGVGVMPTKCVTATATSQYTATADCLAFILVEWDDAGSQVTSYTINDRVWGNKTVTLPKSDHSQGNLLLTPFAIFLHKGATFTFSCSRFSKGPVMYITEFQY